MTVGNCLMCGDKLKAVMAPMDRNRFIQCMKSNVELSDKERRRIIRKSVESQP